MNSEDLTFNIIDRQKRDSTSRLRKVISIVTISIALLIFYLPDIKVDSVEPIIFKGLMIMVAALIVPLGFSFAFKVPRKGQVTFLSDSILAQIGKTKLEIPLKEESKITFYSFKKIESAYFIEIEIKGKMLLFELDIVFVKEKVALDSIKGLWKKQGINFDEKNTPPARS